MGNRDIVLEYLKCFCAGDIDGLTPLIAADLDFKGTLHTYASAAEYLDGLRSDPPESCGLEILSVTESEDCVAVFYIYKKPDCDMKIAQLFKIKDGKIKDVLLVFDGR